MQALIDFDGWRKWKDFAEANGLKDASDTKGPNKFANKGGKGNTKFKTTMSKQPPEPKTLEPEVMETKGPELKGDMPKSPVVARSPVGKGPDTRDFATVLEEEDGVEEESRTGAGMKKEDSTDTVINVPGVASNREASMAAA